MRKIKFRGEDRYGNVLTAASIFLLIAFPSFLKRSRNLSAMTKTEMKFIPMIKFVFTTITLKR